MQQATATKAQAKADVSIFGQESNHTTWRLAKMNLAIRQIENNLGEEKTPMSSTATYTRTSRPITCWPTRRSMTVTGEVICSKR